MKMEEASKELYRNRKNFIIIGLTGRTGSGCTTVADILTKNKNEIILSNPEECDDNKYEKEKKYIINSFYEKNWHPFLKLSVRDVITTYILECQFDEIDQYLKSLNKQLDLSKLKAEFEEYKAKSECMNSVYLEKHDNANCEQVYQFITEDLPMFGEKFKKFVDDVRTSSIITVYQEIGNNIRRHGDAVKKEEVLAQHVYSLSHRTNQIIKTLRNYNSLTAKPDYFVIDAFRNKVEVNFFQERYSAFYLCAVTCDEDHRKDRLLHDSMPYDEIESIDSKEYKRKNILDSFDSFISQDIPGCIEKANVILRNNGSHRNNDYTKTNDQIAKYISLIQHPGLVTPSTDERNMQFAFSAKVNSGCISRQVGASISDKNGNLLAVGWNDSPSGQIPCLLRRADQLIRKVDKITYSKYERDSIKLLEKIKNYYDEVSDARKDGLNITYCFKRFKNIIDNEKNQVHTRSIHAEESAFLSLIGSSNSVDGGTLYTTSSPCVLCAKKAYHLGIERVVYIDPYPDISFEHIFSIGEKPIKYNLFSGAIGGAYHKLYDPIISFKDELISYCE